MAFNSTDTRLDVGQNKDAEIQGTKDKLLEEESNQKKGKENEIVVENEAEPEQREAARKSKLGIEMLEFIWNFILSGPRSKNISTQTLQLVGCLPFIRLICFLLGHQYFLGDPMLQIQSL